MVSRSVLTEPARQLLLQRYHILDTPPERDYDDIVKLAATICETPVATISFIDQNRIWFKARIGRESSEIPRDFNMCEYVASMAEDVVVVADIEADDRFVARRESFRRLGMRFYAGAPLITPEGHAVGTVCVLDRVPRIFSEEKAAALAILARQVMAMLELRRHVVMLQAANTKLAELTGTDPLTGIPTRESFDKKLVAEGARAQRTKQPMSLLLVEIVNFAGYAAEHGQVAADNARFMVAQILLGNARAYDYAACFGPATFAVILPGTRLADAAFVASRLRQAVAGTAVPHAHLQLATGLAAVSEQSDGPSLLNEAEFDLIAGRFAGPTGMHAA